MNSQHAFNVYLLLITSLLLDVAHSAPSHCKCSEYVQHIHIATSERRLILRKKPCVLGRSSCHQLRMCVPWSTDQIAMENSECCCQTRPGHFFTRSVDMFDGDDTIYFNKVQKCQPVDCQKLL